MRTPFGPAAITPVRLAPLAVMALALAGCGGQKPPPPGPAEVGYVTLTTQPVTVTTELTGRTSAVETAPVIPQVTGLVESRLFVEGGLVHAGQPLYQIDPRLYKATLDTSRAEIESAEATLATSAAKLRRYNALSDKAAVSAQETISMALSSSTPESPRLCASEMTDSTNEPTSTQRGQFFRRCAASLTK